MGRPATAWLAMLLGIGLWSTLAHAQFLMPSAACEAAVANAELSAGLPPGLLGAIARAESGRVDAATGTMRPWPWSINVAGIDHVFSSEAEAISAVSALQLAGRRSIDVGCLQVNLMFHPFAFRSLVEAFDPVVNAAYAAGFLRQLFAESGDWPTAVAAYHSRTPTEGLPYRDRVMRFWSKGGSVPSDWGASFSSSHSPPAIRPFAPPPLLASAQPWHRSPDALLKAAGDACQEPAWRTGGLWVAPHCASRSSPFATVMGLRKAVFEGN